MLCYVDLEHEDVLSDDNRRDPHLVKRLEQKLKFEELAGMPCLLLHYTRVCQGWLEDLEFQAVLISGARTDWSEYDQEVFEALHGFIRRRDDRPMMGFCGGHQVIAASFGASTGPIRRLRPDEHDPHPHYGGGFLKEMGITEVEIVGDDPLFHGLPDPMYVEEDHYWEVKELPSELELLATTETSPVQAFRHRARPLYGVQFHPERYDSGHPQGRQLLENFFRLALKN